MATVWIAQITVIVVFIVSPAGALDSATKGKNIFRGGRMDGLDLELVQIRVIRICSTVCSRTKFDYVVLR